MAPLVWATAAAAQTCPAGGTEWASAVDGFWTDSANWTNGLPDATTEACILLAGTYTVTLNTTVTAKQLLLGRTDEDGTQTLVYSGGTLTLNEPSTVFAGGVVDWSAGTLAGSLTNEGLLRLTTGTNKFLEEASTLTNDGTIEHEQGTLFFRPDVEVVNNGTFDLKADVNFGISDTGNRRFENNGLFKKTGGTGISRVSRVSGAAFLDFDNNGTVEAEVGKIQFLGGNNTHDTGLFEAAAGAEVNFVSGTHTIVGTITGSPAGTVQISGATIQDDGAGATINFGGTGLDWSAGTLAGSLTNAGLLRLTTGTNKFLEEASVLTNNGTIEHEQGTLFFRPDVEVVNNATFDSQGDADLQVQSNGNRRFENNGLFKKSAGAGVSRVSRASGTSVLNFDNNADGIVSAEAGTIRADGPFAHAEDALIQGGATVEFASGTLTHAGDTGPGLSPGVLNWTGTFDPQSTATFIVDIAGSGGAGATNGHDQLEVTSSAALNGQIQVNLDGFVPTQGQQFEVLTASSVSGAFTNPNTDDQIYAGSGVAFTVIYEANRVLLVADLLEADIALAKTVDPAVVDVGETATFTVTASKGSDADDLSAFGLDEDIVIKDILPSGLSLVSATASAGSFDPDTDEWMLPELLSDANETLTLEVTVDAAGVFENTAELQAAELPDPDGANDSASATVEGQAADLALEKTVSDASVLVDDTFSFTVTLTNNGPNAANDIEIADAIPEGLDCTVTAADGSYDATAGLWTLGSLAVDGSTTLVFDCTADEAGEYTNVASIQGSNPADPNSDNDEAQATVTISAPACAVPAFAQDASTVPDGFVTLTFTSAEGLVEVNFVDPGGNAALVNFEASTEADFTPTEDGISWSFAGTAGSEPTAVDFILTAVPPDGLEPGEQFTASYFAQAKNVCGSVLEVDPVLTLSTQAPRALAILGNYPNPFGEATTIRFDLPEAGPVQVQVFDLMGREVATLVDAPLSAGTHEVTWNGALSNGHAIASGLYLVRLQAGGHTATQRMTRVR
ncbi:MAG: DUF11 domain-containing protein [Bacteroidetes bacterium]|nr:DUF11 domain-containing protein [Bacteroidota bacterium]